jgi:hypothetical protein
VRAEECFRNRVHRDCAEEHYARVDAASANLKAAVMDDLVSRMLTSYMDEENRVAGGTRNAFLTGISLQCLTYGRFMKQIAR